MSVNEQIELTLILCSRNDNYMGNSNWRLQASLDTTLAHAFAAGVLDRLEILVCDWGSTVPLREVISLNKAAEDKVKFIEVPPSIASAYQKDSPFAEVIALNVAAKRARGDFIGRVDADTIVGEHALRKLFDIIRQGGISYFQAKKTVLFSMRRRVPFRIVERSLPPALIRYILRFMKPFLPVEAIPGEPFYRCYVGIFMMHRALWYECTGYDENLLYWGFMETDVVYRLAPKYQVVNVGDFLNHDFYHLEHYHPRKKRVTDRNWNAMKYPTVAAPNPESWGLSETHFGLTKPKAAGDVSSGSESHMVVRAALSLGAALSMILVDFFCLSLLSRRESNK